MNPQSWFQHQPIPVPPQLRLYCFPYAGGGTTIYRGWQSLLTLQGLQISPIRLPGREARMREAIPHTLQRLAKDLVDALEHNEMNIPYAFYGHSMGAMIAFEVARELRRRGLPMPVRLFVAAYTPPQMERPLSAISDIVDNDLFLEELEIRYNGVPSALKQSAELRALFVPILRADFNMLDHYVYQPEARLELPIDILVGEQDQHATQDRLLGWKDQTNQISELYLIEGGHFFINETPQSVVQIIETQLKTHL
ncbi:MAG: thioesterase II family protein [Phototrophicaceae bacterium]